LRAHDKRHEKQAEKRTGKQAQIPPLGIEDRKKAERFHHGVTSELMWIEETTK
jgi:hypothetical protein